MKKPPGYVLKKDRGRRYWESPLGGKVWIDTPPDDVLRGFYSAIDAPTTVVVTDPARRAAGTPPAEPPEQRAEPPPAGEQRSDS